MPPMNPLQLTTPSGRKVASSCPDLEGLTRCFLVLAAMMAGVGVVRALARILVILRAQRAKRRHRLVFGGIIICALYVFLSFFLLQIIDRLKSSLNHVQLHGLPAVRNVYKGKLEDSLRDSYKCDVNASKARIMSLASVSVEVSLPFTFSCMFLGC